MHESFKFWQKDLSTENIILNVTLYITVTTFMTHERSKTAIFE